MGALRMALALAVLFVAFGGWSRATHEQSAAQIDAALLPWLAPQYLDRSRIERQAVSAPGLISTILIPTLGCPARIEDASPLTVVLAERPPENARFLLVPRDALEVVDREAYSISAPPRSPE